MKQLVLVAVIASQTSPAIADSRCGTPVRMHTFRHRATPPVITTANAGPKLERESFGPNHQLRTSANFALRWRDAAVTDAQAQIILDEAERNWTMFANTFQQPVPLGADQFKLNIYVSKSATDDPGIDFDGGYANYDAEGYPFMVLSATLLTDTIGLRATTSHELYHDFQMAHPAFEAESSWWYWEATAEWAAQETQPDEPTMYWFVGAYALTEELALNHFGDPFGGDELGGVHQYGASVFPKYLTDTLGDRMIVPATWAGAGANDDALTALLAHARIADTAADKFAEFAARAMFWDMPRGAVMQPMINSYAESYPDRSRLDATVGPSGTDWTAVKAGRELHAFSYNTIELARPANGELRIELDGNAPAQLRATVVRQTSSGLVYNVVPFAGTAGSLVVQLDANEPRAHLVVAAVADTRDATTTFPYRFRIGAVPEPEPVPEDGGCSTGSGHGLALLGLVGLFARRRRR